MISVATTCRPAILFAVCAVVTFPVSADQSEERTVSSPEFESPTNTVQNDAAPAFASSDTGTLTVGTGITGVICRPFTVYGYISLRTTGNFGSYSPTGLTGGKTVANVSETAQGSCSGISALTVTGFSSNPGSTWLSSITCNGIQKLGSAASFSYSGGDASWQWGGGFGLINKAGSNVSCTVDHN